MSHVVLCMVGRRSGVTTHVKFRNFSLSQAYHRLRLTTRHGPDMHVFQRYMNANCARQIIDTNCSDAEPLWHLIGKYFHKTV